MADLTTIIENSIADAADAGDITPDATTEVVAEETPEVVAEETVVPEEKVEGTPEEKVEEAVVPEAKKEEPKDELEKELEALGLGAKELKPGERENKLPYSRTRKIVGNAIKRTTEKFQTQVTELTTKNEAVEKEAATYRSVDKLIYDDPDRYMGMLATLHPDKYGKFVEASRKPVEKPVEKPAGPVVDPADPEPTPDHTFEDGSKGFTPEGFAKLRAWDRRQATREAEAKNAKLLDERLGPIEKERQAEQTRAAQVPRIRAQVKEATATWGTAFTEDYDKGDKSEILAVMRANDGEKGRPFLSFDACVAKVLAPKVKATMQADRDKMRAELMKELEGKKKAATGVPASTVKVTTKSEGPRKMEDVIKESLEAAGLTGA